MPTCRNCPAGGGKIRLARQSCHEKPHTYIVFCDKKRVLQRLLNLRRSFFTAIVRYAAALIVPKNAFRQHLFALQKYRWLCHAKRKSTRRCFDKKAMVNALLQRPPLFLVLAVGLEPTRCHQHRILSPTRLPFHHASK